MKLRILRLGGGVTLDYLGGSDVIKRVLVKWKQKREGDVMTELGSERDRDRKTLHCWFCRRRKGSHTEEFGQPLEAGTGKDTNCLTVSRACSLVSTLISAQENPSQTSDLQNSKVINLCGLKPLNWG